MSRATVILPKRRSSRSERLQVSQISGYKDALKYLDSLPNYEQESCVAYTEDKFNLSRMNRLLSALGNPHATYPIAHVAGTKGKGSTCAMLAAMVSNCVEKVGMYCSPHILDVRERIQVNGELLAKDDFTEAVATVAGAAARRRLGALTYFEVLTAAAFHHFAKIKVDLAVVEVGLGGRLDATNVITPRVVGITSISHDHAPQLGNSLAKIAEEKAGVIKPGVPVICAPQRPEVKEVIQRAAAAAGAPLRFAGEDIDLSYRFEASRGLGRHTRLCLTTSNSRFEHLHVPLMGEHQAINCGVALGMVDVLKSRGFALDDQKVVEGLTRVKMVGRMEIIRERPRILVDVAHNAASVDALMRAIGQNVISDSMVVIFGCRRDKDLRGMVRSIQLGADKIIFTRIASPRSADPSDLAAEYAEQSGRNAQVTQSLDEALRIAISAVSREDLICITGSFRLVEEAKRNYTCSTPA